MRGGLGMLIPDAVRVCFITANFTPNMKSMRKQLTFRRMKLRRIRVTRHIDWRSATSHPSYWRFLWHALSFSA